MKKGGFLRNVLDTIRSNQANQSTGACGQTGAGFTGTKGTDFGGQLKSNHFTLGQVARHGFPEQPTALAFDPVQKIAAIGTNSGAICVFGQPGVDVWAQHKPEFAVTHIRFIVNQGAIITVTSDESIHLWSLRGPNLKLQLSASSTSSSPAAQATTPNSGASSISSPQSSSLQSTIIAGSSSSAATAAHHQRHNSDSGAQPGDPDYLTDQIRSSSSPTSDKSKQYSRQPEILHTLKFQREHITCLHQTLQSKWLYVGTERGNVHVVNVETFELSGYSIAWNKAIELSRKTHPGAIIHISECPQDSNKILIGFESGCIVLWDLKSKNADGRYYNTENLLWLSWHYEGKQFVAAHGDGSMVTWQIRSNTRPAQILHPHVKTAPPPTPSSSDYESQQQQQHPHFASTLTRALNNELYRPINKVEWKTSKNNEQFLLFSGGLPYDGLETDPASHTDQPMNFPPNSRQLASSPSAPRSIATASSQQQHLKPTSGQSPVSPSISPSIQAAGRQSSVGGGQLQPSSCATSSASGVNFTKERKSLRPTSLTVMYGKSITVLEMDDTIIDFITICENSPFENDASDPIAVIVLLAKDLILIDLTSSGYPSFESPYPAGVLNESPVTCVQYLADCSSDLIPFLYSTSQNVVSRAPKKGFSDKEWPINGGEWGQPMQSYPELVLTGHADGTIKFWDMSGVNFDLINKIKTSKLFERPQKLPNSIIVPSGTSANQFSSTADRNSPAADINHYQQQQQAEDNYFAVEKIEYCSATKHLLVAGNLSQVIQFRLNKKDTQQVGGQEVTTILVEPTCSSPACTTKAQQTGNSAFELNQSQQRQQQPHHALKAKSSLGAAGSSSGGSSSSASSQQRGRSSGFQAELICLTPLLVSPVVSAVAAAASDTDFAFVPAASAGAQVAYHCQAPPKVTALAFQAAHSILAYSHESGVVLVDVIQKCVILSASIADLYGGSSARDLYATQPFSGSSITHQQQQQHYYQAGASLSSAATSASCNSSNNPTALNTANHNNGALADNAAQQPPQASTKLLRTTGEGFCHDNGQINDNGGLVGQSASLLARTANEASQATNTSSSPSSSTAHPVVAAAAAAVSASSSQIANSLQQTLAGQQPPQQKQQQQQQSRFTTNSMFQRQLSTTALTSQRPQSAHSGQRLFQRQVTTSQLLSSTSSSISGDGLSSKQRAVALLAAARDPDRASSSLTLSAHGPSAASMSRSPPSPAAPFRLQPYHEQLVEQQQQQQQQQQTLAKKPTKNKRIISRMLSISAIHTTPSVAASIAASATADNAQQHHHHPSFNDQLLHQTELAGSATTQSDPVADKIDSSFTRSRSSSGSSNANEPQQHYQSAGQQQQQHQSESIQCLCFLDWNLAAQVAQQQQQQQQHQHQPSTPASFASNNKSLCSIEGQTGGQLALWLGTSAGYVLLVSLVMPDSEDNRVLQLQSVNAKPQPQAAIKLPGAILSLATFTCEAGRGWAAPSGGGGGLPVSQGSSSEAEPAGSNSAVSNPLRGQDSNSPHSSFETRASTFLAIVSEKQARVYLVPLAGNKSPGEQQLHQHQHQHDQRAKPGQAQPATDWPMTRFLTNKSNCYSKQDVSESSFACRSALVQMRQPDESCLVSYLATGNIVVHSLPQLRLLLDADFVPYAHWRIGASMRFSRNGHCLYQPSRSEINKFTISAQYHALVNEMTGLVYVAREMPEMPRGNFFKSLFSVTSSAASRQSDRDELFGECSAGKPSRGIAKHISGLDKLKGAAASTMGHDIRFAREGLDERGEKLSDLEDKTLQMMNQSETYSQAAHQLAQKFKDKKWYQF